MNIKGTRLNVIHLFIHSANSAKQNGSKKGWTKQLGECWISEPEQKCLRSTVKDGKDENLLVLMDIYNPVEFLKG